MQTGDERYLPVRDRGPVRRYIRDSVDARRNLGEYFLPIALVFVVLTVVFAQDVLVSGLIMVLLYVVVLATIVDAFLMWRRLKKKVVAKFVVPALPTPFSNPWTFGRGFGGDEEVDDLDTTRWQPDEGRRDVPEGWRAWRAEGLQVMLPAPMLAPSPISASPA